MKKVLNINEKKGKFKPIISDLIRYWPYGGQELYELSVYGPKRKIPLRASVNEVLTSGNLATTKVAR